MGVRNLGGGMENAGGNNGMMMMMVKNNANSNEAAGAASGNSDEDPKEKLRSVMTSIDKTLGLLHQLYLTVSSFNVASQLPLLHRMSVLSLSLSLFPLVVFLISETLAPFFPINFSLISYTLAPSFPISFFIAEILW